MNLAELASLAFTVVLHSLDMLIEKTMDTCEFAIRAVEAVAWRYYL